MNAKTVFLMAAVLVISSFAVFVVDDADESDAATVSFGIQVSSSYTGCSITASASGYSSVTASAGETKYMSVESGTNVTFTAHMGSGFTFESFFSSSSGVISTTSPKTITVTNSYPSLLSLRAEESTGPTYTYVLSYNANGGTGAPSQQTYGPTTDTSHTFRVPSTTPTRSGYTFLGWAFSSTSVNPSVSPDSDVQLFSGNPDRTLYAVWRDNQGTTYTVTYNANGGTGAPPQETYGPTTDSSHTFRLSATIPTRTGYEFIGWDNNPSATSPAYGPRQTLTVYEQDPNRIIYAIWRSAQDTYTYVLNYDANGGTGAPSQQTYGPTTNTSHTFTIPDTVPTYTGYQFLGWAFSSTSINPSSQPGDNVTLSSGNPVRTLYAVWRAPQITYTLTYNTMGGTDGPAVFTAQSPEDYYTFTISDVVPVRENYRFLGWSNIGGEEEPDYVAGDTLTTSRMNPNITIFAVWTYEMTVTYKLIYNANEGTGAPATEEYGPTTDVSHTFTVSMDTPSRTGYRFEGWGFTSTSLLPSVDPGTTLTFYNANPQRTLYAVWSESTHPEGVYWSNDQYNGKVDILYKFEGSADKTHTIELDLYSPTVTDGVTAWNQSAYSLTVTTIYPSTQITATLTGGSSTISKTLNQGKWSAFVISLDSENGNVSVTPVKTFESFSSYTLYDNQKKVVLDFSEQISGAAIHEILHTESGSAANVLRFQVVSTNVFLNTYGVVLYNPTINLFDYWPQFDALRVNFYSFALYGESITINGITYPVTDGKITVRYVSSGDMHYLPGVMPNAKVQTRTFDLDNIYVTYQDGHAYLTFVSERFALDLGSYSPGSEVITMSGIWYFASMVYEPYTVTEKHLSDWKILPETSSSQMLLIFLAILIVAGAFVALHIRKSGLGWIDLAIIGCAALVAFVMLG